MYKALKQWLVYACILWNDDDDDDNDGDDYVFLMKAIWLCIKNKLKGGYR